MYDSHFIKLFLLLFFSFAIDATGQSVLIPEPAFQKTGKGEFVFSSETRMEYPKNVSSSASIFKAELRNRYGISLTDKKSKGKQIILCMITENEDEKARYNLDVTIDTIKISGNETGIFYAFQSILFLLPSQKDHPSIQAQTIIDSPRFEYRGLHLDVSRHFRSAQYIKKYLNIMAMHKLNRFHWHLTDDQGWRIEIKKYPKLTETGSRRRQTLVGPYGTGIYDNTPHQGFYTQKEIQEIVSYAAERKIMIIPEIEMPGHASAALSAYPFLGCTKGPYQVMETWGVSEDVICAGNDSTLRFFEDVIDEVAALFPGKYIHIGGDECPKTRWKTCEKCQLKMQMLKLKDEHELQSYFIKSMERHVNTKNKSMIGWDEILEGGLAPNAVVMSWRGESGGIEAAKMNHQVIMTPGKPLYFDHTQSLHEDSVTQGGYNSLEMVYGYNPIPTELDANQAKYILGAQANMWTEYMNNEKKLEYMLLPRISALSESVWGRYEKKDWNTLQQKLPWLFSKYDFLGLNYSRAYYDLEPIVSSDEKGRLFWNLKSRFPKVNIITQTPNQKEEKKYEAPIPISSNGTYIASLKNEKGISLSSPLSQAFYLHKASGMKCTLTPLPDYRYPGNGSLTLVDGILNDKGLSSSSKFLGYWGQDVSAMIDLEKETKFSSIKIRFFQQPASWIYAPESVTVWLGNDSTNLEKWNLNPMVQGERHITYDFNEKRSARFIKLTIKCSSTIPENKPGGGNPAWLFMDEVIVE
ncbi:MAG: hypothetical protein RIR96_418 [Bacteroidota bacterium]